MVSSARGPLCLLLGALVLTILAYWPGLSGGFLFDDFPNLEQLGARGPIDSLEQLRSYLASGFSGPTGRPLSLLSFLIDANDWPADAWAFKRTNLIVHLLVGLTLFAVTRRLLRALGRSPSDAGWIAAMAAGLWLLNPFLVSTTLYAVQRMTQLAALFALAGIWCYLLGRELLNSRPKAAYAIISIGVPVCTLLATLSKENGALTPLLIWVIHAQLNRTATTLEPPRWWAALFLALPSALIFGYLLMRAAGAERSFASRDFSLYERLLSQPRFLWDYVYHLLIPHVQTQGLYQDGRAISSGLISPWTTLPALLGLLGVAGTAWMGRNRWPLLSLAILFFLAANLLESTVIPLELYFEHRSYLPAAFLFLPIAAAAHDASLRWRPVLVAAVAVAVTLTYAFATWQRATLWGDNDRLLLVWAETNPGSDRAQVSAAQIWLRRDQPETAIAVLEAARERMPDSILLLANWLAFRAAVDAMTVADLEDASRRIRGTRFDAQGLQALELLVEILNARAPQPEQTAVLMDLLSGISAEAERGSRTVYRKTTYLQGVLLAGQGQADAAMPYLLSALDLYHSVDTGLRIVADLATLGYFRQALEVLSLTEEILTTEGAANEPLSEDRYRSEISRIRAHLLEDIESANGSADPLDTVTPRGPE